MHSITKGQVKPNSILDVAIQIRKLNIKQNDPGPCTGSVGSGGPCQVGPAVGEVQLAYQALS